MGANVEEVTGQLAGLSDDDKAKLKAALATGGETEAMAINRRKISDNEAKLRQLHIEVMTNKMKLYAVRAMIEENRAAILKNYVGAFIGNRQAGNQNTDDIFKNRTAILDALKVEGQVQENFRNSKYNESNADFLTHRSRLNNRVAKSNIEMSKVNAKLIEINSAIMKSNEEIVGFNSKQIAMNKEMLAGVLPATSDEAGNAELVKGNTARIEENAKRMQVIADRCVKYDEKVEEVMKLVKENKEQIDANAKTIEERRDKIIENRINIYTNGQAVSNSLREAGAA